ncbi:hypothetical protein [Thalassiella azotivora]
MTSRVLAGLAAGLGALALTGLTACTSDDGAAAPPPTPTASATGTGDPAAPSPSPEPGPLDCDVVAVAQGELEQATGAELERLGLGREDPRAFPVTLFVATRDGADYWEQVRGAVTDEAPADLRDDVAVVAGWWTEVGPRLAGVEVAGPSSTAVQEALTETERITADAADARVTQAQQRVQAVVDATCGTLPDAAATTR